MTKVIPEKVWEIVEQMRVGGETIRLIADDEEAGIMVYAEVRPNSAWVYFTVYEGGTEVYYEVATDEDDCEDAIVRIYSYYLDDDCQEFDEASYLQSEADEREADIEDREFELLEAATDFVTVMIKGSTPKKDFVAEDFAKKVVDAVAKSLYRGGVDVYRPMYLQDEDTGDIDFYEFPYGELA